jgi:hypothetical protein
MPASFSRRVLDSLSSSSARRAVASAACSAGDGLLFFLELGLTPFERALLLGQLLFAAAQRLFGFLQLGATLLELVASLGLRLERQLFGFELCRALDLGGFVARGFDELLPLGFGRGGFGLAEHHHPGNHADDERGEAQDDA